MDPEVRVSEPPLPVIEIVPFPIRDPSVTIAELDAKVVTPVDESESVAIEPVVTLEPKETNPEDESVPKFTVAEEKLALAPVPTFNKAVDGREIAISEPAFTFTTLTACNALTAVVDSVPPAIFRVPENVLRLLDRVSVLAAPVLVSEPDPLSTPASAPEEMESEPLSAMAAPPLTVPRVRVARLPTVSAPAVMVVRVPPPFAMRLPPLSSVSFVNPATVTVPPLITAEVKVPPTVTEPPETFELKLLATLTVPPVIEPLEIEPLLAKVVTPVPDKLPKTTVPDVPLNVSEPNSATVPKVSEVLEKLAVVPILPVNSAPLFTSTALNEPPLRRIVPVFARAPDTALKVPAVM